MLICGLSYYKKKGYARFLLVGLRSKGSGGVGVVRVVLGRRTIQVAEEIPARIGVGHPNSPGGEPLPESEESHWG